MSTYAQATKEIYLTRLCQPSTVDIASLRASYPKLETVYSTTYCEKWNVTLHLTDDDRPVELELVSLHKGHQKTGMALIDPAFGVAGPDPDYILRSLEAESCAVDGNLFFRGIIQESTVTELGIQVLRNIRRFALNNIPGGRYEALAGMLSAMPELEHLSLFKQEAGYSPEFARLLDTVRDVCPALKSLSLRDSWPEPLEVLHGAEVAKWLPELRLFLTTYQCRWLGLSPEGMTGDILKSHWEGEKLEKVFLSMDAELRFHPAHIALELRAWLPWCDIEVTYTEPPHAPSTSYHLSELNRFLKKEHYASSESVQAIFPELPSDDEA
jgi:hypothetical protein